MTTLIYNCSALLMDEEDTLLENAFVSVEGPYITAVGTERLKGHFGREIDGGGKVLMPGLVNAHTHVPMTLLRGYGGGHDLQTWLTRYIFPVEDRLDMRAVRAGTQLGLMELIASGVTTIADMYIFCDGIAEEVAAAGLSANIARGMTLFTPEFDRNHDPAFLEMKELAEKWHGHGDGQILVDACIHGEYTSGPALWEAVAAFARDHNLGMHIHVSETENEQKDCLKRHGKTPIQILDEYGLWETRSIAAHCVWTTEDDWVLMAKKGITAVHNPVSNLKLGSGIARIPAMRKRGVPIALGTDGVSSNNSHDMFEEMKFAAILHNGVTQDPLALLPQEVLRMATADGAAALGRHSGQIAEGFVADLILIDMTSPHLIPCHSVVDNLIYSARGSDVAMNMSRGQIIYKDGEFLTIDREKTEREVMQYALPRLFDKASV